MVFRRHVPATSAYEVWALDRLVLGDCGTTRKKKNIRPLLLFICCYCSLLKEVAEVYRTVVNDTTLWRYNLVTIDKSSMIVKV